MASTTAAGSDKIFPGPPEPPPGQSEMSPDYHRLALCKSICEAMGNSQKIYPEQFRGLSTDMRVLAVSKVRGGLQKNIVLRLPRLDFTVPSSDQKPTVVILRVLNSLLLTSIRL